MKEQVTTGIRDLDRLVGGLYIGDNVLWYDNAGSLADVFYLNLIRSTLQQDAFLIYVSFDRSLKNLLEKLGPLGQSPALTIIDCFTYGKGNGADIFVDYHLQVADNWPGKLLMVKHPDQMEDVAETFYAHHRTLPGTVRFIFESLTGMQDLWGGEEPLGGFYVRTCPRLYDLNTIAYWLIEKNAHSAKFRAQINQIAQVVIDLSVSRGKTSLEVIKAENRTPDRRSQPLPYFSKDATIRFNPEAQSNGKTDLGTRIKTMRTGADLSQTELARKVGVTPSSISQIESGLIYPSLPALYRMAEVFGVDMGTLFHSDQKEPWPVVYSRTDMTVAPLPSIPESSGRHWYLPQVEQENRHSPHIVEIPPGTKLQGHFFHHKGDEVGYLLAGQLTLSFPDQQHAVAEGDFIYIKDEWPDSWENPGETPARLLWLLTGRP